MRHQATNWLYHILASSPTAQDGIELCMYTVRIGMASTSFWLAMVPDIGLYEPLSLVLPLAPEVTCQLKLASAIQRCWQALFIVVSSLFLCNITATTVPTFSYNQQVCNWLITLKICISGLPASVRRRSVRISACSSRRCA
jgi:hypothetical protein